MDIKISNLSKQIKNLKILDNISLKVNKGEIFGLIGPNGAGKTTIVRLMLDLYKPTSGKIFVNDINVQEKAYDQVKKKIGFLLDNIGLFKDLNAWDNLEFFDRIYYPNSSRNDRIYRIEKLLKMFNLYNKRYSKINFFSRGMKQRLALARSIINNPELLILDEPSRGLDLEGKTVLREFIKGMHGRGCTVFVNSHNLDELQKVCTNVAFIDKGKIVEQGNYENIKEKFAGGSYLLKAKGISCILKNLQDKNEISYKSNNEDEVIITCNNKEFDISEWLFSNGIKIIELKKINDNLENIYNSVISSKKSELYDA